MVKLFPAVLVIAIVVALSVVFFLLPGRPIASQTPSSTSGQSTTTSQTSSYTSSPATSSPTSQTSSSTSAQTTAEYVVAEYLPGEYSGTKSPLNYGEVNYNLRYDYSFSTSPFSLRLWDDDEGQQHNASTVTTKNGFQYGQWNGGGTAYVSKSGVSTAMVYDDSGGSFVDDSFGWLGDRTC